MDDTFSPFFIFLPAIDCVDGWLLLSFVMGVVCKYAPRTFGIWKYSLLRLTWL